ncbi:MAG: YicC family protein [Gammaproteobacteria bacterium]
MIHSMTAFARREEETPWGVLIWELRTVNHRYLEMSPRLPEDFRVLESQVRERVSAVLQRGKVECQLRFQSFAPQSSDFALNKELIGRLVTATAEVDRMLDQPAAVNALEILRWPGVIQAPQPDHEQMAATALRVLEESLTELTANRAREGMKLKELILARCDGVAEQAAAAAQRLPEVRARLREKLLARLADIKGELDPMRMEQEMVLLAQRLDVEEELDRLAAHLAEVRRVLDKGSPAGRRLDFLMQELHREANPLGAKSGDVETTRASMEMKVLIEQMREQVQNIE